MAAQLTPQTTRLRQLSRLTLTPAVVAAMLLAAASTASAADGYLVDTGNEKNLIMRAGPDIEQPEIGKLRTRVDRVTITCTTYNDKGQLWDNIGTRDKPKFVLDKWVRTGSTKPVAPDCKELETPQRATPIPQTEPGRPVINCFTHRHGTGFKVPALVRESNPVYSEAKDIVELPFKDKGSLLVRGLKKFDKAEYRTKTEIWRYEQCNNGFMEAKRVQANFLQVRIYASDPTEHFKIGPWLTSSQGEELLNDWQPLIPEVAAQVADDPCVALRCLPPADWEHWRH